MAHGLEAELESARNTKSRHGSIPANVQTLMKTAQMVAFADEISKLSVDEAVVTDAAQKLQRPRPWRTIGQTALMVGAAAPAIEATGKFTKGFTDTHGSLGARFAGGVGQAARGAHPGQGVRGMTAGDVAARSLTAGLGGGVIAAAKEGIEVHNARKAIREYLGQAKESGLLGGLGGAPSGPAGPKISTPAAPTLGVLRGSSNKSQRVGNTPIAAKSGVTNSSSGDAMNPRRNLGDAMRAYKT